MSDGLVNTTNNWDEFKKELINNHLFKKLLTFVIVIFLVCITFTIFPSSPAVKLYPGTANLTTVNRGVTITFNNVNVTIRGHEAIPINNLTFLIYNFINDTVISYVIFNISGSEISDPDDKFTITTVTDISHIYQSDGSFYGVDEETGWNDTGYPYSYGYGHGSGTAENVVANFTIDYNTDTVGTFYTRLSVNSASIHQYNSSPSTSFIVENNPPVPIIEAPSEGFVGDKIILNGSKSYDIDDEIVSYYWSYMSFNASHTPKSIGYGKVINNTWDQPGVFNVDLKITDNDGAIVHENITITISFRNPPVADPGGPYTGYVNTAVIFDGSGSYDNGSIISYYWNFEDGETGSGVNPSHVYTSPGTYTVLLIVTDDCDETDVNTTTATITQQSGDGDGDGDGDISDDDNIPIIPNEPPVADANGPYYEIENNPITFDGSGSHDPDDDYLSYEWDFGDDNNSLDENPTHTYNKPGNYTVKLTVTDDGGKTDSDTSYALISAKPNNPPETPIINGTTKGQKNIEYNYTALSSDIDNDQIRFIFNWGDNTQSVTNYIQSGLIASMNHTWLSAGIYSIYVIAIDEKNASSQKAELTVLIDVEYVDDIGYLIDYNGDNVYDSFFCNKTGKEELMEYKQGSYLLDSDGDGIGDFTFGLIASSSLDQGKSQGISGIVFIIALFVIVFLLLGLWTRFGGRRHPKIRNKNIFNYKKNNK